MVTKRILGIDPGSRITGYGVIDAGEGGTRCVVCGCVRLQEGTIPQRLKRIFEEMREVVRHYAPVEVAVEQVFMHRNAASALKLGQARGAAICAALLSDLRVYEYAPRQVKLAVVGSGGADKAQVQHMVKVLLGLSEPIPEDEADALAVALCHNHTQATLARFPRVRPMRSGRWR